MEKLIFPGHIAKLDYIMPALQVYVEAGDWLKTADYIEREFAILKANGIESEMKKDTTDYTKDAELPRYFGFVERQIPGDIKSDCRITSLGKRFYDAVKNKNQEEINESVMIAFETITFGKNNDGCPGSNTRLEAPNILLIASLMLDGVSRQEYAGILYEMLYNNAPIVNALAKIKICREKNSTIEKKVRVDNKIVPFLVNLNFLLDDGTLIKLAPRVKEVYQERITKLPTTNNIENIFPNEMENKSLNDEALQIIFYGAPGTGKSHDIKERTKGKSIIRTTFHPDSDYSTFVGAYKPSIGTCRVYGAQGPLTENGKPIEESKITYQFVKQAFLKAYLSAWKKYSDGCSIVSSSAIHEFCTDNGRYVINSVGNYELILSREFQFPKSLVSKEWPNLWNNGVFSLPTGPQTGKSVQHAIANWIVNKLDDCSEDSFEQGWETLVSSVNDKKRVIVQKTQTYIICGVADDNETLTINVEARGKKRATLQRKFYESDETKVSKLEKTIIDILKGCSNDFDEAWDILKKKVDEGKSPEVNDDFEGQVKSQFLVIEEINRGNCAQIFGDIFQLLDRGDNGFSLYPIEADSDIRDAINKAFNEEEEYMLTSAIDVEDAVENYTSNYDSTLSDDIRKGRVLLLPPNLYIWATMNTSDQSLFPIDSAFKRRWDWKYMKIKKGKDENGNELDWRIEIKDKDENIVKINDKDSLSWWDFISKINVIIASMTSSADKQLGYFFCKADNEGIIDADTFVSKVIFYLWNDVFKDYGFEDASLFQYKAKEGDKEVTKDLTFPDFFDEEGENINEERLKDFLESIMNWKKKDEEQK